MARPPASSNNRSARFVVLASSCVVIAALYFLRDVLMPLALSVLITFLLAPVVNRLERLHFGRVMSVVTVMAVIALSVVVLGWVVAGQTLALATELPQYKDNIVAKVQRLKPAEDNVIDKLSRSVEDVQKEIETPTSGPATQAAEYVARTAAESTDETEPVEVNVASPAAPATQGTTANPQWVRIVPEDQSAVASLAEYAGLILGPLGTGGIVFVFVLFMLLQRDDLRDRLIRLVGHGEMNLTTTAIDDAASRISRYLLAQAIVNGTYGLAVAGGLWLIGATFGDKTFPNFVLWGLLCALLRFVPYIGPWIAAAFPILVSFAVYPGFGVFAATIIFFVILEVLSNNVMEPILYGSSTGMSAVAILVSAVFWTFLWGPVGLLLATPMTVCVVVLGKHVPQLQFLDIMLGDEPVLDPHERVYQRLLAMDEEDATDVAAEYLGPMSLELVYDTVLIPALALAEKDRHEGRLDDERQAFIHRTMRVMIDELADQQSALDLKEDQKKAREASDQVVEESRGAIDPDLPTPKPKPIVPRERKDGGQEGRGSDQAAHGAPAPIGSGLVARLAAVGQTLSSGMLARVAETMSRSDSRTKLPSGCVVNVVCLPAHDEADEIVGLMLSQLMEREGFCASAASVESLASEMLDQVAKREAHIVCVSAIPPAAVSHARYLCKRVHARFPELEMVVGLWSFKGNLDRARERITCARDVSVYTTLTEAMDQLHQLAQPILLRMQRTETPGESSSASRNPSVIH